MWRASSIGPDWLDLMTQAQSIGKFHNAVVAFTFAPEQDGHKTVFRVVVTAMECGEAGLAGLAFVDVTERWPHANHKTIEGLTMALLHVLDYECTQNMWAQSEFKPE